MLKNKKPEAKTGNKVEGKEESVAAPKAVVVEEVPFAISAQDAVAGMPLAEPAQAEEEPETKRTPKPVSFLEGFMRLEAKKFARAANDESSPRKVPADESPENKETKQQGSSNGAKEARKTDKREEKRKLERRQLKEAEVVVAAAGAAATLLVDAQVWAYTIIVFSAGLRIFVLSYDFCSRRLLTVQYTRTGPAVTGGSCRDGEMGGGGTTQTQRR
jgi:hypothetical protein